MILSLRLEDKLDGATNFRSWKVEILLVLEENDIQDHVKEFIWEPKWARGKPKFKNDERNAKRMFMKVTTLERN